MDHKKRIKRLEQLQPVQAVETIIKVIPGGAEYYKMEAGQEIRIEQAEYDQHIAQQVKAGPVNIDVKMPDSWKGFNGEL